MTGERSRERERTGEERRDITLSDLRHQDPGTYRELLGFQENEITEYHVYCQLARREKEPRNQEILQQIAEDELRHYLFWKELTGQDVKPDRWTVWKFGVLARLFGITFALKLLERSEETAHEKYLALSEAIPKARRIAEEEDDHEHQLIDVIEEERLKYMGSVVLGLNDALVELTGVLAGLTFALQDTRLIAMTGLITGVAASLSMAASEYLSQKTEGKGARALRSSLYTGATYVITVILLILPFFLISNPFYSLLITVSTAVLIIALFTYYISIARGYSFRERFLEMVGISLGVALLTFLIGYMIRVTMGIDI